MARQVADQQKISYLIAGGFLLILISAVGFGSAVMYSMTRQTSVQDAYVRSLKISNAGLEAHATLAKLHNRMLEITQPGSPQQIGTLAREMLELDRKLRQEFATIKAAFPGNAEKFAEAERLLDNWQGLRQRMVELARNGQRGLALKLAISEGLHLYSRLGAQMDDVVASSRQRVEAQAADMKHQSDEIIHLAWWFLTGLIAANIFCGGVVIRKVRKLLEHDKQTTKKLYDSEERLKLALSGADEGTWDLDLQTGRLNFDARWGEILGYVSEQERPNYFDEWAMLIHAEDRESVLKAMQNHTNGQTSEYRAEYRIRSRSGALKWVLGHGRAVRRGPDGKALRVVGVTRDITLRKQAEERIWQLAHSDALTGLPNRVSFYDRLRQAISQARRHEQKIALLFLDLDGFKQVNDRFGHDIGDALLKEVAERLRQNIRGEDIVARTGGDEFIFVLYDVGRPDNAGIVAGKIIQSLTEPFEIQGNTCLIGGSIGSAIFPDDSNEVETLVTHADDAMYQAKGKGKSNYQFFNAVQASQPANYGLPLPSE